MVAKQYTLILKGTATHDRNLSDGCSLCNKMRDAKYTKTENGQDTHRNLCPGICIYPVRKLQNCLAGYLCFHECLAKFVARSMFLSAWLISYHMPVLSLY